MRSYPTDEELKKLIEEVEKEPLYAPRHLKEEILKSLAKQDIISVQKLRQNKIQMFTYSMKIAAGMIAALFLVFLMPQVPNASQWTEPPEYQTEIPEIPEEITESELESALQRGSDVINETSAKILNKIMILNHLFDQEDECYEN